MPPPPSVLKSASYNARHLRTLLAPLAQGKVVQAIIRTMISVLRVPGLSPLVVLYILYCAADSIFSHKYFPADNTIWQPAFPYSWRFLLLTLFVTPAFALVQLVWLLLSGVLTRHFHQKWEQGRLGTLGYTLNDYIAMERDDARGRSRFCNNIEAGERLFDADEEQDARRFLARQDEYDDERNDRLTTPRSMSSAVPASVPRRLTWCRWIKFIVYLVLFSVSFRLALDYEQPEEVLYRDVINNAVVNPKYTGYGRQEKIFIAAVFSNNRVVLPYWSATLLKVIHYIGTHNVFISIIESGSSDHSSMLLHELDGMLARMKVERRILTDVKKPEDTRGNSRIDYLAAIRNRALEPLIERGGYDRIVFSDGIYIDPESFIDLIDTNDGEYDMACALDFGHYGLHDTWAIRDELGKLPSTIWPYFFHEADYQAIVEEKPVPVFSCWNGIAAFAADPLLPIDLRSNRTLSTDPLPYELPPTHPAAYNKTIHDPSPALTPPISFRSSAPGECFSSESFLLPYDMRRQFNMQRIYVNPRVITGYQWRFYVYFKWFMRHRILRWWIEKQYDGAWMQKARRVGAATQMSWWDGGECLVRHP